MPPDSQFEDSWYKNENPPRESNPQPPIELPINNHRAKIQNSAENQICENPAKNRINDSARNNFPPVEKIIPKFFVNEDIPDSSPSHPIQDLTSPPLDSQQREDFPEQRELSALLSAPTPAAPPPPSGVPHAPENPSNITNLTGTMDITWSGNLFTCWLKFAVHSTVIVTVLRLTTHTPWPLTLPLVWFPVQLLWNQIFS